MLKKNIKYIIVSFFCSSLLLTSHASTIPEIRINEVFPNPKGKDDGKEWIELYNFGTKSINIENWTIKNKNEFKVPKLTIAPKSHQLIISKINLRNKNSFISIIDDKGNLIDTIKYKSAPEGLSYSRVIIHAQSGIKPIWIWSKKSKLQKNPTFYEIHGTVIRPVKIDRDYNFKIKSQNKTLSIIFDEHEFKFEELKDLINIKQKISILVEKVDQNTYSLVDFSLKNNLIHNQNIHLSKNPKFEIIFAIVITILGLFLISLRVKLNPSPA